MSEDLIKRSDAIRALNREKSDWNCDYNVPIDNCIKRLNKVKFADRPQGEWIYGEHDAAMCDGYRCDRCGFFVPWDYEHKSIDFINDYNFCPNCGARMKGADDEAD